MKKVIQEAQFGGEECLPEREEVEQCNAQCCVPGGVALTIITLIVMDLQ